MKPLLAHTYEPHRISFPCFVQPKLNGIRALYQNGRFQSRDEQPFPVGLLDHLAKPLQDIFPPPVILDGELYVHGWPLQRINAAVTPIRNEPTEDTKLVEYHVFDVVDFKLPFKIRMEMVNDIGAIAKHKQTKIHRIISVKVHTQPHADEAYKYFVERGYEGMMYRLGDCPYTIPKQRTEDSSLIYSKSKFLSDQDNRVWHLLKRKSWQDSEFSCIGITEGEGKYKGMVGALVCETDCMFGCPKHKMQFSVSSGLTDAERIHYFSNPPIEHQIKIRYLIFSSDGIPLNPSILAIL